MFLIVVHLLFLAALGWTLEDVRTDGRRQTRADDESLTPTVKWMEAAETSITVEWTPPSPQYDADFCLLAYNATNNPVTVRIPVSMDLRTKTISGLNRNTLYDIRLFCIYGGAAGPATEWFHVATRTASVEPSICPGTLPNAALEPYCLERPEYSSCEFTCKDGYRKSDVPDVIRGDRSKPGNTIVTVFCSNGIWITYNEDSGYVIDEICLPEAAFQKCPLTMPNGVLEPHCGPATDWLCKFDCNEGYARHPYMTGMLKSFGDPPYMLYCDGGVWKTGYEELGVGVSEVCLPQEYNCTNSDEIPNGRVLSLPCPSGYVCGFECDDGFHKHALAWDNPFCENGRWGLRTTKYDPSVTPETLCVSDDARGVCPETIPNGELANPDCMADCRPRCNEGYYLLSQNEPGPNQLSCEGGKWLTHDAPYTGDNICFPQGGIPCPSEIPNGAPSGLEYSHKDHGSGRLRIPYTCNEGFRRHYTLTHIECIAGQWKTWHEQVGQGVSALCIPQT